MEPMRLVMRCRDATACFHQMVLIATIALTSLFAAPARATTLDDLVSSVVQVKTFINPDGTSVQNLGKEREGSGVVIDESGLVLTIGYLMVEAHAAEIVTGSGRPLPAPAAGDAHTTRVGARRRPRWWATATSPASGCCARSSRRRSNRCRLAGPPTSRRAIRCWSRAPAAPGPRCRRASRAAASCPPA